jgi:hypothetical protein
MPADAVVQVGTMKEKSHGAAAMAGVPTSGGAADHPGGFSDGSERFGSGRRALRRIAGGCGQMLRLETREALSWVQSA